MQLPECLFVCLFQWLAVRKIQLDFHMLTQIEFGVSWVDNASL